MPLGAPSSTPTSAGEGPVTTRVVAAAIVAGFGGVLFGYDIGVTGGVTTDAKFLQVGLAERRDDGRAVFEG